MSDDVFTTALDLETPLDLPYERAQQVVRLGKISDEHGLMRWGSNYTVLVSITLQNDTALAIYKPRQGERPLWDFPDGTLCNRETMTYLTSEALGWRLVPPTALREGLRGKGSVQLFVHHDPEVHYFTFNDNEAIIPQLKKMALFDAIINNADRKGGHCLLDPRDRLWGIDHGLAFHYQHKLRTVIWDFATQPIPAHLLDDLERLCQSLDNPQHEFTRALEQLLSERERRAFHARIQRLLSTKQYPLPGPGPNRPWPPV